MRWWLRTSPTRWLLLSSGNMARNTRAQSWRYSSKETCTRTHGPSGTASIFAPIHIYGRTRRDLVVAGSWLTPGDSWRGVSVEMLAL